MKSHAVPSNHEFKDPFRLYPMENVDIAYIRKENGLICTLGPTECAFVLSLHNRLKSVNLFCCYLPTGFL